MRSTAIILAAVMGVGGIGLSAVNGAGNANATPPAQARVPVNANQASTTDARIAGVFGDVTQAAMTPRDMGYLVTYFPDAQEQVITKSKTYAEGYGKKLDGCIDSISQTWKQKYGHEFEIRKAPDVFGQPFATIQTQSPSKANAEMETGFVQINGMKGTAELTVPLVCEKNGDWRINAPISLTAEKLRDNLAAELGAVEARSAHWPAAETDAYRMVAHHVLMAVLDKPQEGAAH